MVDDRATVLARLVDRIESARHEEAVELPEGFTIAEVDAALKDRQYNDLREARTLVARHSGSFRSTSEHLAFLRQEIRAAILKGARYNAEFRAGGGIDGDLLAHAWMAMGTAGAMTAAWNHQTTERRTIEHWIAEFGLEHVRADGG